MAAAELTSTVIADLISDNGMLGMFALVVYFLDRVRLSEVNNLMKICKALIMMLDDDKKKACQEIFEKDHKGSPLVELLTKEKE